MNLLSEIHCENISYSKGDSVVHCNEIIPISNFFPDFKVVKPILNFQILITALKEKHTHHIYIYTNKERVTHKKDIELFAFIYPIFINKVKNIQSIFLKTEKVRNHSLHRLQLQQEQSKIE